LGETILIALIKAIANLVLIIDCAYATVISVIAFIVYFIYCRFCFVFLFFSKCSFSIILLSLFYFAYIAQQQKVE